MTEMKQLKQGIDLEFFARALVSVTWGAAIMFARNIISVGDFRSELIRGSMCLLLPVATNKSARRMAEILDHFADGG